MYTHIANLTLNKDKSVLNSVLFANFWENFVCLFYWKFNMILSAGM